MALEPTYYHVATPGGWSMTWIGGQLLPDGADHVWLTTPSGKPVLRVRRDDVQKSNRRETAERLLADMRAIKANRRSNEDPTTLS